MHTNLVSALQVVTNRYTDGDGNVGKEITSDYILETMQAEIDKQSELAMRGLGRAMFSKGLPPARHSLPVGPGEITETMTYTDVYGCHPTAPYHQVIGPVLAVTIEEAAPLLLSDVIAARRRARMPPSNKWDPVGDRAFPVIKKFLDNVLGGVKEGGGDKNHLIIRETFWERFMEFGEDYFGPIPDKDDLKCTEDAKRYLKPYLYNKDDDEDSGEQEEGGADRGGDGVGGTDRDGDGGEGTDRDGDGDGDGHSDDGSDGAMDA